MAAVKPCLPLQCKTIEELVQGSIRTKIPPNGKRSSVLWGIEKAQAFMWAGEHSFESLNSCVCQKCLCAAGEHGNSGKKSFSSSSSLLDSDEGSRGKQNFKTPLVHRRAFCLDEAYSFLVSSIALLTKWTIGHLCSQETNLRTTDPQQSCMIMPISCDSQVHTVPYVWVCRTVCEWVPMYVDERAYLLWKSLGKSFIFMLLKNITDLGSSSISVRLFVSDQPERDCEDS